MRETKPKPRAVAQARKPIVWQGSKLPLLNVLVPMVQAIEHTCYVEVIERARGINAAAAQSYAELIITKE